MGERKPGKYWDHRECRWAAYAPETDEVVVPAQPQPDAEPALPAGVEADVRSG